MSPDSRVVLLGVSEYHDERLPAIPVVPRCLADLRATFTDPTHGLVAPEHCSVLLDEFGVPQLGRRLTAAMADARDVLVVYFVGHGIVGRRHELYLAMRDSDLADPVFGSLPYTALRDRVLDSPAATKIVVLDCCYSGRAIGEPLADSMSAVVGQLDIDGTYLLTSAQRDQVSLVLPGEEHTAFTGRLLRLLRSGIAGGGEFLTIDELYQHLRVTMTAEGLPSPEKRGTRTADRFRIMRNLAATPELLDERLTTAIEQGRITGWADQLPVLREIHTAQAVLLGDDHESCWRTRQHIALAVGAAGDPRAATDQLRELIRTQTRNLGGDHPDTLRSRQFLAVCLGESEHRDEAIQLLRTLVLDRRRVLGAGHADVWRSQHVLARELAITGHRAEAVALLVELVAGRRAALGPAHADTRTAQRDLQLLIEAAGNNVV